MRSKRCLKRVGPLSPKEIPLLTKMHQNTIPSGHNSVYRVSWRVLEKVRGNESDSIYILTWNPLGESSLPLWLQSVLDSWPQSNLPLLSAGASLFE